MLTAPDLVACVVELVANHGTELERSQGHRAHALFLRLIDAVDPRLAEQLHAPAQIKPWTITPLPQQAQRLHNGDVYPLRVSFLQSSLYLPFARAFLEQPQRPIQIGEGLFSLQTIHTTHAGHPWAGVSAWSELIRKAVPADEITLHFGSPTVFSLGGNAWNKHRFGLLPDGGSVFKSLLKRWNAYSPNQIDPMIFENVDILPKKLNLQTEMLLMTKSQQLGFIGTVTYKISGEDISRHLITALADAAIYLGVGAKTTQGMGLVRRIA